MAFSVSFSSSFRPTGFSCEEESKKANEAWRLFKETIGSEKIGFFHANENKELREDSKRVFEKFKHKKYFVQVGIGGSSLGSSTLVEALGLRDKKKKIFFLDNIDPEQVYDILKSIQLKETLFYFVSKSGGTAETLAVFSLVLDQLKLEGVHEEEWKESIVCATDPESGALRKIIKRHKLDSLTIPPNIGGRFSAFTPVSYLPALFVGIDIDLLCLGASKVKEALLNEELRDNDLFRSAFYLKNLKDLKKINQTVFMPYSSKLKLLSSWFVQLWAESLGKKNSSSQKNVHEGLTPIPAYGATDQHSQLQLFMEGPRDKCILFVEVESFQHDFKLKSPFEEWPFSKLNPHSLSDLMDAEFRGTLKGLDEEGRPYIRITIPSLNEETLGAMILFFQSLTVFMGLLLEVNPFDQPGVELGKKFSFDFLETKREKKKNYYFDKGLTDV
ncbi:MAG: glucose-6-phosphate isomerase [Bdellovibrionota bacterium]|nr:glucose-6-phosphate isomerase [Bdellovibrionota bacterium]MEC8623971.1 glucose-6-phosphate isomerase [Bdellovibrionota bacterium]